MFRDALIRAFNDVFEHLGSEIIYTPRGANPIVLTAVIKEPENPYEIGDSQTIGQVAEVTLKSADITPRVGDILVSNSRKYKIYAEPLLDASNYVWKLLAVLVEK
ncbi:MAG: hypothetical protein IJ730_04515 [Alphaproteobacteria bacterium]|nr:hypothetical protein [Alphaproteobacteria bacterium]